MSTNQFVAGENDGENANIGSGPDGRVKGNNPSSEYRSDRRNLDETETSKSQRVEELPSTPVVLDWERGAMRGEEDVDDDDDIEDDIEDDSEHSHCDVLKTSSTTETEGTHDSTSKMSSSFSPETIKVPKYLHQDDDELLGSNRRFTDKLLELQPSEDFVEVEDTNSGRSMSMNANDEAETSNHGHGVGIGNNGGSVSMDPHCGDGAIDVGSPNTVDELAPNGRQGRDTGCLPCSIA